VPQDQTKLIPKYHYDITESSPDKILFCKALCLLALLARRAFAFELFKELLVPDFHPEVFWAHWTTK
jgi:hypothetical protein